MPTPHEAARTKVLTQAEFRAWLDERPSSDLGHYELLNGRIVVSPVPDLVVEILSPSTRKRDLTEKKDVYARNGVDEYWIIDPGARSMTIFSRVGDAFDHGTTCSAGPAPTRLLSGLDTTIERLLEY